VTDFASACIYQSRASAEKFPGEEPKEKKKNRKLAKRQKLALLSLFQAGGGATEKMTEK